MEKTPRYWVGDAPAACDLCHATLTSVFVDGRTKHGPWANMCPRCHASAGCGLGLGKGQKYTKQAADPLGSAADPLGSADGRWLRMPDPKPRRSPLSVRPASAIVFKVTQANPARSSGYDAPRTFPDFKSAERSARALVRGKPGRPVEVDRISRGADLYRTQRVAQVRSDALGRIWTDIVSWEASPLL